VRHGSSADRQLKIFAETNNLHAVVDDLLEQSSMGT